MVDIYKERLDFVFRMAKHLENSTSYPHTLNKIIDEIIKITRASQGYLFLLDQKGELIPIVKRSNAKKDLNSLEERIPRIILLHTLEENKSLISRETPLDPRFSHDLSVQAFGVQSFLCFPIQSATEQLGILYIQSLHDERYFSRADLEIVDSMTASLGLLLKNNQLKQLAVDNDRMQRELHMARDVQQNLVPKEIPAIKGWDTALCWQPAYEVGGDFYDLIPMQDGKLGVIIADVSDKGMPAALFMTLSITIFRAVLNQEMTPAEMITRANALLHHDAKEGMFVTLFFGILDTHTGELTYVNAGHNPPLWYHRKNNSLVELQKTGMAAGLEPDFQYMQSSILLHEGDFLFLYTDGALDAVVSGKPFNEKELLEFIRRHRNNSAYRLVDMLKERLCIEDDDSKLHDDLTIIAIKKKFSRNRSQ